MAQKMNLNLSSPVVESMQAQGAQTQDVTHAYNGIVPRDLEVQKPDLAPVHQGKKELDVNKTIENQGWREKLARPGPNRITSSVVQLQLFWRLHRYLWSFQLCTDMRDMKLVRRETISPFINATIANFPAFRRIGNIIHLYQGKGSISLPPPLASLNINSNRRIPASYEGVRPILVWREIMVVQFDVVIICAYMNMFIRIMKSRFFDLSSQSTRNCSVYGYKLMQKAIAKSSHYLDESLRASNLRASPGLCTPKTSRSLSRLGREGSLDSKSPAHSRLALDKTETRKEFQKSLEAWRKIQPVSEDGAAAQPMRANITFIRTEVVLRCCVCILAARAANKTAVCCQNIWGIPTIREERRREGERERGRREGLKRYLSNGDVNYPVTQIDDPRYIRRLCAGQKK
ncbi:hypothetical protein RND71_039849 [Anisodus tanguticus]|uniref:Uncharacterized protein n=1 Tax=Anisodus tanguticus TaxID=243964 RepID=A0AAE1UR11_9SOLA|nr:hypothetical protein RND71_039849 [Anisodus tanguticus]